MQEDFIHLITFSSVLLGGNADSLKHSVVLISKVVDYSNWTS